VRNKKDLIGEKFGTVTVTGDAPTHKINGRMVRTLCTCGTSKDVRLSDLRRGFVKSCGCKKYKTRGRTNKNLWWTDERKAELTALAAEGRNAREIAEYFGRSVESITLAAHYFGVKVLPAPPVVRQVLQPVWFPQFEDVANPDADRRIGRVPQRQDRYSLTGNSSEMCARP